MERWRHLRKFELHWQTLNLPLHFITKVIVAYFFTFLINGQGFLILGAILVGSHTDVSRRLLLLSCVSRTCQKVQNGLEHRDNRDI